ncbi:hypothetical protein GE061_019441 [Apolygus lucorum]|uniref:Single domain-containing protein n=1 Tax=Apolygus lucorum TaxID=248454 RepID=A0A6A4JFR1_APOLU|nr:hypothetical protein GE061_019441 [Apolygus lucorum]
MHTWLILACLFGVVFTKAVKPPKGTEGVCNYYGLKIREGVQVQPPGMCYLTSCKKATYKQGEFHQEFSHDTCPDLAEHDENYNPWVRVVIEKYPECCDNPIVEDKDVEVEQ